MQAPNVNTHINPILPLASTSEARNHDIVNFLQRAYSIDNFLWSKTSPRGTVLATYRFPDQLLAQAALAAKTRNFFGLRAGVEFTVLVNKQQFQAGNLLISYIPNARYNPSKVAMSQVSLPTITGQPRTNLDLMDATKAMLTVPFSSPFIYYNLVTGDGTIGDFQITVYSPLTDVADAGTVSVQVFARFVDVDLEFPTGSLPATFSSIPIMDTLMERLKGKPNLTDLTKLVKEGTAIIEKIKSNEFKFQMNNENVSVSNFKPRALPNMAVSNISNNAHIMSLSSSNMLPSANQGQNSNKETYFKEAVQIPCYHDNFPISNQPSGTNVWSKIVSPLVPASTNTDGSINVDYVYFHAQPFSKWRGSLCYHFRAVKTTFHSLRIRVWFSPASVISDVIDRNAVYSKIIDLKDINQFSFEIPFVWPHPFLNVHQTPSSLGTIGIDIINQMVFPSTVSDVIDIIVERSAGTDFDVNLPTVITQFPFDPTISSEEFVRATTQPKATTAQKLSELQVNKEYLMGKLNLSPAVKQAISGNIASYKIEQIDLLDKLAKDETVTSNYLALNNTQLLKRVLYHEELRKKKRDLTQDGDVESNPGPVFHYMRNQTAPFVITAGTQLMSVFFDDMPLGDFQLTWFFSFGRSSELAATQNVQITSAGLGLDVTFPYQFRGGFNSQVVSYPYTITATSQPAFMYINNPIGGNFGYIILLITALNSSEPATNVNIVSSVPISTNSTLIAPIPLLVSDPGIKRVNIVESIPLDTTVEIVGPLPLPVVGSVMGSVNITNPSIDVNVVDSIPLSTNSTIVAPIPIPITGIVASSDVNIVSSIPLSTNSTIVNPLPLPVSGFSVADVTIVGSLTPLDVNASIVAPLPLPVAGLSNNVSIIESVPLSVNANIVSPLPLPVSGSGGGGGGGSIVATTSIAPFLFQMRTEQDSLRNGFDDTTFQRPVSSSQADALTMGQSVTHVEDMIKRSSVYASFSAALNPLNLIQILPHAFGIAQKDGDGLISHNGTDLLSYYANSYTFARGGVNLRVVSAPDFYYNVVLDPDANFYAPSTPVAPLTQQAVPPTAAQLFQLQAPLQQIVKPSLEGFGEISVPFYSDSYMYSISPAQQFVPSTANTQLQLPYTQLVVQPNGLMNQFQIFRAACSDFEFSYLNGPPILLNVTS
jgi:hypothetical protein